MGEKTLFEKIIDREIPAEIVYEDDLCLAFNDISPQAPCHILIIPKKPVSRLAESTDEDKELLGHLLLRAKEIADNLRFSDEDQGFRIVINNGKNGGETVPHLHVHILAGRPLLWPPG